MVCRARREKKMVREDNRHMNKLLREWERVRKYLLSLGVDLGRIKIVGKE